MTDSLPVLLVDDDLDLCSSLSQLLRIDGLQVTPVHDGEAGVREAISGTHQDADLSGLRFFSEPSFS
jgi:DNA-binding response OmpR family regulator